MNQKSIASKNPEKTITSEDILGKDVIDIDGAIIGVVEKVLISPAALELVGISVDKGFLRKGLTIGKKYISKITPHAVVLNIRVSHEIKGKKVYDNEGMMIGVVTSIDLEGETNVLAGINVRRRLIMGGKELSIPVKHIRTIGEGVMLRVNYQEENTGVTNKRDRL
jgi:sporulation protein YlmC with PRC-barrel domain